MTLLSFKRVVAACFAAALSLTLSSAQTPSTNQNATIVTMTGKVEVSFVGSTAWMPTHTNEFLKVGDRVRTGKSSRATLRLSNQSVLRVYELTTLEIQAPSGGKRTALNLQSGAAYFFDRDKPLETQFRTPSASGAIRGTEFNLAVDPDGRTELALLDGQVGLTNEQGSVDVNSGEKAVVEKGRAPTKSPMIDAVNIIQWTLYYPGTLDADELNLDDDARGALGSSLEAYRSGDLTQALAAYPENRTPGSASERVYRAALLLAVGQVPEAQNLLKDAAHEPLAEDLLEVIASIKGEAFTRAQPRVLATDWLAGSYAAQAHHDLAQSLQMAKNAAAKDPHFGFALERLAEMEFSFGHTDPALTALRQSLQYAPRNAQALALEGFVLSGKNKISEAADYFDRAIAVDGALANAWLGRGLVRIKRNDVNGGRKDLETAAALEPNRAFLRSYLGKAWSMDEPLRYSWNSTLALRELGLAKRLDPKDPTAWLYSALLNDQRNCINQAIKDLEESQDLNGNRAVFRSKFMLDQDQAVRSANLALIYQDAGFTDVAVREATRAVEDDYANYSAHLFLSESYDALIDPRKSNLRYETPWENELLLANLLAPVSGGALSQNVSQQEYSRLFATDHLGVISQTEFLSQGAYLENLSQFGILGDIAYSLDYFHYSDPGFRPNNDINENDFAAKVKLQLSAKDTLFVQAERSEIEAGDLTQFYDQTLAEPFLRTKSEEDPSLLLGYHRQWSPGQDTLLLYRNLQQSYTLLDPAFPVPFDAQIAGTPPINFPINGARFFVNYFDQAELNSLELQHIFQTDHQRLILGARYQSENDQITNIVLHSVIQTQGLADVPPQPAIDTDFTRYTLYGYYQLKLFDQLRLTAGGAWDRLRSPQNSANPPVSSTEAELSRISPKAGLDWTPDNQTRIRAAYSRSVSGLFNSSSTLIEPSEIAGFNQAYRTLIPESTSPATVFETWGAGIDHIFPTHTYVNVEAELLNSKGGQQIGAITNSSPFPVPDSVSSQGQNIALHERDISLNVNQMISDDFSLGASYHLTSARITYDTMLLGVPLTEVNRRSRVVNDATLNQLTLFANCYLPCGFFGRAECTWWGQYDAGFGPTETGDQFWQANVFAGYRFPRRHVEIQAGILNLTDRDYHLDPLTYYVDPARRRTFVASLKFSF
ncbi:MAG TPA: TonB-dependent receptor [Verrucomicrobiae bacterium]|jgi:Tfp pilus assembly protein PilF|nr:TonB-dependent receptor [Verrucomicrobiae bacterium]